jgi:cytochrome P450
MMQRVVAELDANLPDLGPEEIAYPITVVEASLPFLRNCVKENFRINPVFTMPLARRVMAPEGITLDGEHFPQGTSLAVCNHAFHHNPDVWGSLHNIFNPDRWDDPAIAERSKILMHFGLGGRQCIGKTIATTNIYKLASSLLREFEFEVADPNERSLIDQGFFRGKLPSLVSVGISDLEERLIVKVRRRKQIEK